MLAAIAAIALMFFPWVANPFALKQELALLLCGAALWYWAVKGGLTLAPAAKAPPSRPARVALLLVLVAAASNLPAQNPPEAWLAYSLLALGILLFLCGHLGLWSPGFPRRFAATVFWTSLPISLVGIAQAAFPGRLDFGLQALGKMAAFSTLGNPQFVGAWLVFAVPLYFVVAAEEERREVKLARAGVALTAVAGVIATRSASAFLALAAACWLALVLRTRRPIVRTLLLGLGLVIPVVALWLGWSTHTGRGRMMIWSESLLMWKDHPLLGVGQGQFNLHQLDAQHRFFGHGAWTERFHENASFVLDAHNQYLQILAEQGVLGLGCFVVLIVAILYQARGRIRDEPMTRALAIAWCGQLVLFLWNAPLFYAPMVLLFWITAGLLVPVSEPVASDSEAPRPRVGTLVVATVLVLSAGLLFWMKHRAGVLERRGDALLETGPFPAAVTTYRAAVAWAPQHGYAWEKLALAQYFAGDTTAALVSLQAARERLGDVGIRYLEAEILTRREDYARARAAFEFIRGAFPQHVTPSFTLGQIYRAQGDTALAEAEFIRVLNLPDSRYNLKLDRQKIATQRALAFRFLADIRRRR